MNSHVARAGPLVALLTAMRIVAALIVVQLVSGCVTPAGRKVGAVAAGFLAVGVASTVVAARNPPDPNEPDPAPGLAFDVAVLATAAALVTGVLAIGVDWVSPQPDEPAPLPAVASGTCDPHALELTRQARRAARLGQCSAASSLGDRVREIDPACYAIELVAIRCG